MGEYHKRYYEKNKDKIKDSSRRSYYYWRNECIIAYGGKCSRCDISEFIVLDIDHVNNNGAEHRKKFKTTIYRQLAKENYPPGYQVLCANCHRRKTALYLQRQQGLF